jgi:hypothetical protein
MMALLNVSDVINDPLFVQSFSCKRQTGSWVKGEWTPGTVSTLTLYGTITPASPKDIDQIPEADRVTGMMAFYSISEIFVTRTTGTSDILAWGGEDYKVLWSNPYSDYGYFKALAVRMKGY